MTDKQSSFKDLDPKITSFINSFKLFPWFQNVGKPIDSDIVLRANSWEEAWESLQSESWTHASFHERIDQQHPAWILAYDKVKQFVIESGNDYELEDDIFVSMQAAFDAAGAAYELLLNDNKGYYLKLIEWYRKGYWPCGWDGDFPKGNLIVY